jgi:CRISPR-associated protein Csx17
MPELLIAGCNPTPLASYLKALGIFRLVAEQVDSGARAAWSDAGFLLSSTLDAAGLEQFFLEKWRPSPVLTPWNGGSGFYPKDNKDGILPLRDSSQPRFASYRDAIRVAERVLVEMGMDKKPDAAEQKPELMRRLRAEWSDAALDWLDAVVALLEEGPVYPPLLGTGGNDGRLDFANNQMQRLVALLIDEKEKKSGPALLRGSLWNLPVPNLSSASVGQFSPAAAGGANAGPGFSREALQNPWDYVLMMEGTLLFAGAASRRLERADAGVLAYPFTVRSSAGGYGSAADVDEEGRGELWLPLWRQAAGIAELRSLFSEGRASVPTAGRSRAATNGLDFARAVAALGVDRGLSGFERYGLHKRNGLSFLATPLGRWQVARILPADRLAPLDGWLKSLRISCSDDKAPASLRRSFRELEGQIFDLCAGKGRLELVMGGLAAVEEALATSQRFTHDKGLRPVPPLDAGWVEDIADESTEFRLALALAAVGLRERRLPVRWERGRPVWMENEDGRTVWANSSLERNLIAWLLREEVEEELRPHLGAGVGAADLRAWIEGEVDEARLESLAAGFSLIPPEKLPLARYTGRREPSPPPPPLLFALLAAARQPATRAGQPLPRTPGLLRRAAAGDSAGASALAQRRLWGAGFPLAFRQPLNESASRCSRIAAALIWPLDPSTVALIFTLLSLPDKE